MCSKRSRWMQMEWRCARSSAGDAEGWRGSQMIPGLLQASAGSQWDSYSFMFDKGCFKGT